MLIKLGFWTPVLFFLTLKSGFPETSSQLTPSSSGESCANLTPRSRNRNAYLPHLGMFPRSKAAFQRHLMRVCRHRAVRNRLQAVPFSVAAGQHLDDARHPLGRSDIDTRDPRMRVRLPDHIGIGLAREVHVVGKVPTAGQQPRILAPPNRLSDPLRRDLLS